LDSDFAVSDRLLSDIVESNSVGNEVFPMLTWDIIFDFQGNGDGLLDIIPAGIWIVEQLVGDNGEGWEISFEFAVGLHSGDDFGDIWDILDQNTKVGLIVVVGDECSD